jgi:uncharacterized membrane protein YesL
MNIFTTILCCVLLLIGLPLLAILVRFLIPIIGITIVALFILSCVNTDFRHWLESQT